ncbi:MAG TPA: peptidylprolyl isomerase [Chthonomonadaceae bacterium]|nr:peptidylprolyl isomerase [Chthonomonadaceae bacterium]
MMRSPLSVLLTAVLATAVLSSAPAQQNTAKPPANSAQSSSAKKTPSGAKTPPKPAPASSVDNDVVGVVNNKNITWGQLIARIHQDQPQVLNGSLAQIIAGKATAALFGPNPKESFTITRQEAMLALRQHPNPQIVQNLELVLNEEAINQQAAKEGVNPTVQQLDEQIARFLAPLKGKDPSFPATMTDDQFLMSKGVSRQKMRNNIRTRTKVVFLIEKDLSRQLGHPVSADDFIQASHVLVGVKDPAPDAKPEEKQKADADALAKINQIADDIKTGKKTFAQAAKENSDDPGTKENGGDLGIFMRGTMLKEFENAAFSAKSGIMTAPVRSQYGYHLILVTKHGSEMTADDRQKTLDDYEAKQIQPYLIKLTGQLNKVENRLAGLVSQQQGVGMIPGGPGR